MKMEIEQYRQTFLRKTKRAETTEVGAFSFGNSPQMADELGDLVVRGIKTGTSSGYELYGQGDRRPAVGDLDIVLDGQGRPLCVVENVKVDILSFGEITDHHAYLEGEGDRSLAYWRKEHLAFFVPYYQSLGIEFSEASQVIFEEFKVIYV